MSREEILQRIRQNKPQPVDLPQILSFTASMEGLTERFMTVLTSIGGGCTLVDGLQSIGDFDESAATVNGWKQHSGFNIDRFSHHTADQLRDIQYVLLEGSIGVAENGAVWISEKNMVNRLLPFICQQLVLLIEERNIVPTMHEAYERIRVNEDGYGVFIAGPSKTADIEQSLVVGAHGPLALQVFVVREK